MEMVLQHHLGKIQPLLKLNFVPKLEKEIPLRTK